MRALAYCLIFYALILSYSCLAPYELETTDYVKVVVVDGLITNEDKNHEVLLNYTSPIEEPAPTPISDVLVKVVSNESAEYEFVEILPGKYRSVEKFAAQPGTEYKLVFTLTDGSVYSSTPSMITASPEIDTIYNRYSEQAPQGAPANVGGIQFFLDTYDESGEEGYFRYEWQENYKISTPVISRFVYEFATDTFYRRETLVNICYEEDKSNSLLIANSAESSENSIVEFPIRFVSGETDVLRNRYAIQVKQYAVGAQAYNYYRNLKEMNEGGGTLFDQQQGAITGNVFSENNPSETVLGYFEVSGVSSKRQFFNYGDLDPEFAYPNYRYSCSDLRYVRTTIDSIGIYLFLSPELTLIDANEKANPQAFLGPVNCCDCTSFASPEKPSFWID